MSKKSCFIPILGAVLCLPLGTAFAADATPAAGQVQNQMIYGSQLMTPKERVEYRDRLRAAKTIQERERIRQEHHEEMMELAKKRGVTLPAVPPAGGAGMGPGAGMMGTGTGGGMGAGPRR